ncbi:MAG: hypothetical protein EOO20_03275 [Chryseobacterium sp.]|nr:MAG: hypothetical protein EOO20_03275 [Chryseobacterium sp.]
MESIKKWIESGCDYSQGVAIYGALPNAKPVLLRNFKARQCALNLEKLKYELRNVTPEIISRAVPAPAPSLPKDIKEDRLPVDVKQTVFYHQLPAELRPVLQEANSLFGEMCLLKVSLNELDPDQESEAMAMQLEIFYKRQQNALCWKKIDYWRQHKKLPAAPVRKVDQLGAAKLYKRQQQLFSSRSKLTKRLQQNEALLEVATNQKDKLRLERNVAKQKKNLLQQEEQLFEITQLIESKHEQEA